VTGKAVQVKASADALMQLKERFATWRAVRKLGMVSLRQGCLISSDAFA
jgi:hypothetical protein